MSFGNTINKQDYVKRNIILFTLFHGLLVHTVAVLVNNVKKISIDVIYYSDMKSVLFTVASKTYFDYYFYNRKPLIILMVNQLCITILSTKQFIFVLDVNLCTVKQY